MDGLPGRPIPRTGLSAMSESPILTEPESGSSAMHETQPSVHLIARPALDTEAIRDYLRDVGGEAWLDMRLGEAEGSPNPGELLVEVAGRACYGSWGAGVSPG